MADDKTNRSVQDRARVRGEEAYKGEYFARKHGITAAQARDLIEDIGNGRDKLDAAEKLGKKRGQGRVLRPSSLVRSSVNLKNLPTIKRIFRDCLPSRRGDVSALKWAAAWPHPQGHRQTQHEAFGKRQVCISVEASGDWLCPRIKSVSEGAR
jgi:hypothetical protein